MLASAKIFVAASSKKGIKVPKSVKNKKNQKKSKKAIKT
jgi:hypothetical protein